MPDYPRIASFHSVDELLAHMRELGLDLPADAEIKTGSASPLAAPMKFGTRTVGNRWCIHPMEGWDGTAHGLPSDLTIRRWQRFGSSGAKLIWGGEAVAVRHDGRANPNQLRIGPDTAKALEELRQSLVASHVALYGQADDLVVGVQLTHSGRFCRPNEKTKLEPRIAYHHPILDRKFGIDPNDPKPVFTDAEIDDLVGDFVKAAKLAQEIGFDFVDVKHCHGYFAHELLSAYTRPGRYGGDLAGRTNFLRQVVRGIQRECPGLMIGVRLSAWDMVPFRPDPAWTGKGLGPGVPEPFDHCLPYRYAFGCQFDNPLAIDLTETKQLLDLMRELGVVAVNITAASPYYNPHLQRPALFPPSDGYQPPEDPLVGVNRQIQAVRELKAYAPDMPMIGSAYTYLQDYLPHVAQAVVERGWVDSVGIGRMVLAYPTMPADAMKGQLDRRLICRTFSDCTTAPRNGMVSGCYPLDPHYKERPERERLALIKKG